MEHWCETGLTFKDGGPYHVETSLLICSANQWSGFYMIGTSVMKELNWRCGVEVISTAQLHLTHSEIRFCAG